jgi:transketolase
MPHLHVVRPADANETVAAWRHAMTRPSGEAGGPVALVLSRQDLPVVTAVGAPGAERGAYILAEGGDVTILATGSEVSTALAARDELARGGVSARVVSMPCWDLFAEQDAAYKDSVLGTAPRVSVEAGTTFGWREWLGARGAAVGIDRFGASAPGEVLLAELGVTASAVVAAARRLLSQV